MNWPFKMSNWKGNSEGRESVIKYMVLMVGDLNTWRW